MTISFPQFANGQTNYVSTLNGITSTIASLLDGILNVQAGALGGAGASAANIALFGTTVSVIGAGSYSPSGSSAALTVAAGYAWKPSLGQVVRALTSNVLDFTGQSAATYYVELDGTGAPSRAASNSGEAVYSVVWTGSAFGAIARLANIVFGAADDILSQTSTALAATYTSVDARMEAGEALAVLGALARTWQTGRLSLSVAGSSNVTLTALQANNAVLNFTGVLTGNISVIVPLGTNPREWIVTNNTTGAYTLTVKGVTGTGIAVDQGGFSNLYQDGTNVLAVSGSGAGFGTVTSVAASVPAFLSIAGSPVTSSGTLAITYSGTALPVANGGTGGTSAGAARTALGVAIGSDVQAHSSALDSVTGTNTGDQTITLTGDVTGSGTGSFAATIASHAVTLAKMAQVATARFLGRTTASTGDVEALTGTQATALMDAVVGDSGSGGTKGLVPAPASGDAAAGRFLKADGTFAVPPGTGGSGTVTTVSVTTANGVSGTVATATTTPAITLTLGAITPTTIVASSTIAGSNLSGTNTGDETTTTAGALILGAAAKTTPVDADYLGLMDSAASNVLKKLSWLNLKATLKTYFDTLYGSGSGSVTTVSVTTANGVSGSVATATSTPAITLTLGAITPSTVNSIALSGSSTPTLAVTGTTTVSGANTGDQTTVSGNAGTATALQTARTIGGTSFNGTANITQPFDMFPWFPGIPTASAKLVRAKVVRAIAIPANFAGSDFTASANATASTVFDVQKNGSSIGTVTIAAAGVVPTFATSGGAAQSLAAGDIFAVIAPASPDATLADPSITFAFTR